MKLRSDSTLTYIIIAVAIWYAWKSGMLASLTQAGAIYPPISLSGGTSTMSLPGAQNVPAQPPTLNDVQGAGANTQPVAPVRAVEQPTPAAPPANIKVPDYKAVQAAITPEAGGSTSYFAPSDPVGQINAQVASNLQMADSSKNFGLIGTIPGGGNDVKVFTASGWLSCAAMKNVNQYDGDLGTSQWYFAMPPDYRQKAVDACRKGGY